MVEAYELTTVSEDVWSAEASEYEASMRSWLEGFRARRMRNKSHPVYDFLFVYYQMRKHLIEQWHPAPFVVLEGQRADIFLKMPQYTKNEQGVFRDMTAMDARAQKRLRWILFLLKSAQKRSPRFNCFGLHEWAMVYRSQGVRHEQTPLRLSMDAISEVVDSHTVCCSHYDAFRFFTPDAVSLNSLNPGKEDRADFEQFGCVHFNMDLYKWCYKMSPWLGSQLLQDAFTLAIEARQLDMQASPYDLSEYGFEPIKIETAAGKLAYQEQQMKIYERGQVVSKKVIFECERLANCLGLQLM